ncbi:bacteriochlorophyll 4-vinyl reductase [Clostridium sp. JN-9]|uniref:bacteriochlorophyll 4-vinyl reductase n=1 Tax=Clostridium sp. JN-9 TaxID=2507159 RepID=UPI000FFDFF00|nr:bacteriochlorophyll 4-vinyl reductase [Clostridium sp. JN-9]QAT39840.1 bacteriochlorophyll 4-vinyl reductase [Clostridium sp. JN-9]
MENIKSENKNGTSLVNIISSAIQIPGIKVNRDFFLREQFNDVSPELLQLIIEKGPVEAKCSRIELRKMARKLVHKKTLFSTGASFAAGLPGGFAMAATIPADMIQFYGVALGLAQEISYLYGEGDLWSGDIPNTEEVTNQLILYCGVMLGASGAAQTVRVLSSSLAKQALKKLPQKALTKTFYYPIVKSIAKAFGAKMTKEAFAKGISKAVPLIGGVVSGGITFATLPPMGMRLVDALDEANFVYSHDDFEADWSDIAEVYENEEEYASQPLDSEIVTEVSKTASSSVLEKIQEAKKMLDAGIISDVEFSEIKAKLIAQM